MEAEVVRQVSPVRWVRCGAAVVWDSGLARPDLSAADTP